MSVTSKIKGMAMGAGFWYLYAYLRSGVVERAFRDGLAFTHKAPLTKGRLAQVEIYLGMAVMAREVCTVLAGDSVFMNRALRILDKDLRWATPAIKLFLELDQEREVEMGEWYQMVSEHKFGPLTLVQDLEEEEPAKAVGDDDYW